MGATMVGLALLGGVVLALVVPLGLTLLGEGFQASTNVVVWLPALQLVRNLLKAFVVARR